MSEDEPSVRDSGPQPSGRGRFSPQDSATGRSPVDPFQGDMVAETARLMEGRMAAGFGAVELAQGAGRLRGALSIDQPAEESGDTAGFGAVQLGEEGAAAPRSPVMGTSELLAEAPEAASGFGAVELGDPGAGLRAGQPSERAEAEGTSGMGGVDLG